MIFYFLGLIGFLLFFLYDINQIYWHKKILSYSFALGMVCLFGAVFGAVIRDFSLAWSSSALLFLWMILGVCFLLLLIYTLFFALPFDKTYIDQNNISICSTGVYGLCRHPGVLWLFLFLLCWGFGLDSQKLLYEAVLFTLCNLAYVLFQDKVTFMILLPGYGDYKKTTPFLLPTKGSFFRAVKIKR